jgi:uncharacterized protein
MEATTGPGREPGDAIGGVTSRVEQAKEEAIAPIADPAPLGLAAFALTTFVLSFFNAGLLAEGGEPIVFPLTLAYGGIAQLLAGMWEFKRANTFGAVAFSSYGAFWLSFWALQQFYAKSIPEANLGDAVGLFLIAWGIFTAYMWIASFRVSVGVNAILLLLTITFFLLGIGDSAASESVTKAGGWFGIVTAIVAWYVSFAGVVNHTVGREVMPVRELH